jgi:hypothetical protein
MLGGELLDQAPAVSAQRRADRDLPLSPQRKGEQQVGHIGAGHQQKEAARAKQQEQRLLDVAHPDIPQRHHPGAHALVAQRVLPGQRLGHAGHVLPRHREGDSRPQAPDHRIEAPHAVVT